MMKAIILIVSMVYSSISLADSYANNFDSSNLNFISGNLNSLVATYDQDNDTLVFNRKRSRRSSQMVFSFNSLSSAIKDTEFVLAAKTSFGTETITLSLLDLNNQWQQVGSVTLTNQLNFHFLSISNIAQFLNNGTLKLSLSLKRSKSNPNISLDYLSFSFNDDNTTTEPPVVEEPPTVDPPEDPPTTEPPANEENSPPLAAFPGAEGDGAQSVGGRGGKVLIVNRLDDPCPTTACTTEDLNNPNILTPGTLRWALIQPYPRTVVFQISGVIDLQKTIMTSDLTVTRLGTIRITSPYLTVAGQTAPEGGITVKTNGVSINTHDVVFRYIKFRTGRSGNMPFYPDSQNPETFMIGINSKNVIVDHCSFSWMPAEGVSIYTGETYYGSGSASDITLSYNIIGEGLIQHDDGRGHPSGGFMSGYDGDPSFAAQRITLHHNLIVHTQKRNGDVLTKSGRLINNLIYNWQWLPSVIAGGVTADIINNSYKAGPVTQYSYDLNKGAIHLVPSDADINLSTVPYWWHSVPGSPSLYLNGNQFKDQSDTVLAYDTDMVCHYRNFDTGCTDINTSWLRNTKLQEPNELGITIDTTLAAETKVLAGAGSSQRIDASGNWINNRDSVDNRFVNEYKTGSYLLGTKFPWHEDLVGGQSFVSNQVNFQDNDKDGMPDSWEIKYGLNPNDPTDAIKKTLNNQGYTNIEVYFNGL